MKDEKCTKVWGGPSLVKKWLPVSGLVIGLALVLWLVPLGMSWAFVVMVTGSCAMPTFMQWLGSLVVLILINLIAVYHRLLGGL